MSMKNMVFLGMSSFFPGLCLSAIGDVVFECKVAPTTFIVKEVKNETGYWVELRDTYGELIKYPDKAERFVEGTGPCTYTRWEFAVSGERGMVSEMGCVPGSWEIPGNTKGLVEIGDMMFFCSNSVEKDKT